MSRSTARNRIDYRAPKVKRGAPGARERASLDWYVEPLWAIDALLDEVPLFGASIDPACGSGNIVHALHDRGYICEGADIVDRVGPDSWFSVRDFLTQECPGVDNVVCNPPFNLAEEFIKRGLEVASRKVAMLLRWSFAEGGTGTTEKQRLRRWCLDVAPLSRVLVFSSRVSMPPGGMQIEAKGGAVAFGWFVWDHEHKGPATFGRLHRPPQLSRKAKAALAGMPAGYTGIEAGHLEDFRTFYSDCYELRKAVP